MSEGTCEIVGCADSDEDEGDAVTYVSSSEQQTIVTFQLPHHLVHRCRWLSDFLDTEGETQLPFSAKDTIDWLVYALGGLDSSAISMDQCACLKVLTAKGIMTHNRWLF